MRKALAIGSLALGACACQGGRAREERPPVQPAAASSAMARIESAPAAAPPDVPEPPGMPRIDPVLDDPRLAIARDEEQAGDASGAARVLESVRSSVRLDPVEDCAWSYVDGRLHLSAGELPEAVAAFDRVEGPSGDAGARPCALSPYAALRAAQTLLRMARYDDALAEARRADGPMGERDDVEIAIADAYAGKGDRADAVPVWRARLAANPHGARWAETAVALATALLDGADGKPESHAGEAFDLATRVLVEAPAFADRVDAVGLRARALAAGGQPHASGAPTQEERAEQAQSFLEAGQPKHALEAAESLLKSMPRAGHEPRPAACKAAIVRAQATPRAKTEEAADAWGAAIARCQGQDALVTALYFGAKASVSARRPAEALARFHQVEKLFPKHRLADDACFRAAVLTCDQGNETRGLSELASLPDAYPEGDMAGEALFRVALARLAKRDLAGAGRALDRMLAEGLDGTRPPVGRAAYFRARVAQQSGDLDEAKQRYAALIEARPLGYYMLLAYARLRALDPAAARAALESEDAASRAAPPAFFTREHPELASAAFERFERLLEVGEIDAARREARAGGLLGDGADPEVLWAVAWLFERAGAPDIGHSFARARLSEYRGHWPTGRWRFAWEVAFPRPWETLVAHDSETASIPQPLTWAIMREESAFNPDARSVADAIGLMQLIVPTARATAHGTSLPWDEESLRRPEVSIALGTKLLSTLRASFSANPALAIAAYNGGARAVRRWLAEHGGDDFDVFVEHIPFDETRAYIKRVLASEAAYAYLYDPSALDDVLALPMSPASDLVAGK